MDDPTSQPSKAGNSGWSISEVEAQPKAGKVTSRRRKAAGSGSTSTAKKKRATSRSTRRRTTSETKPKKTTARRRTTSETKPKKTTARRRSTSETKPKKTTARRRSASETKPKKTTARRRTTSETKPKKTTARRRSKAKGGLADLIAEILTRKGSGVSSPVVGPILERLAKGFGLSSDASQAVVAFVLGKLLAGRTQGAAAEGKGVSGVDGLMQRMGSGQGVDKQYVISSGMAKELAEQANLDPDVAAASLTEALGWLQGTGLIAG